MSVEELRKWFRFQSPQEAPKIDSSKKKKLSKKESKVAQEILSKNVVMYSSSKVLLPVPEENRRASIGSLVSIKSFLRESEGDNLMLIGDPLDIDVQKELEEAAKKAQRVSEQILPNQDDVK